MLAPESTLVQKRQSRYRSNQLVGRYVCSGHVAKSNEQCYQRIECALYLEKSPHLFESGIKAGDGHFVVHLDLADYLVVSLEDSPYCLADFKVFSSDLMQIQMCKMDIEMLQGELGIEVGEYLQRYQIHQI